jgi:hypothetical protein
MSTIFPINITEIIKEKLKDAHFQTPTSPGLVIATAAPLQASHTYIYKRNLIDVIVLALFLHHSCRAQPSDMLASSTYVNLANGNFLLN